uniref:Uncharacterized protein n=1 Tax=Hyaloperonospora arabidopsidis (strain Emoy2) TaxID=559515 RepID=M4BDB0_HYAAE
MPTYLSLNLTFPHPFPVNDKPSVPEANFNIGRAYVILWTSAERFDCERLSTEQHEKTLESARGNEITVSNLSRR